MAADPEATGTKAADSAVTVPTTPRLEDAISADPTAEALRAGMLDGFTAYLERIFGIGMESTPALLFGLMLVLSLPVLLVFGAFARRLAPENSGTTRRLRRSGPSRTAAPSAAKSGESAPAPGFRDAAIFAISGCDGADDGQGDEFADPSGDDLLFRFGPNQLLARIGRETDNDIRLDHSTVHRYHAIIERRYGEGYLIADLSEAEGNGVLVNGERVIHRLLEDGDTISLGARRLRFDVGGEDA